MTGRRALFASVFAALALLATPAVAITYGEPDAGRHPNVGVIVTQLPGTIYGKYAPLCSGTLIAPEVFLTAAHCVETLERDSERGDLEGVWVSFDDVYAADPRNPDTSNWIPVWSFHADPTYALIGVNPHNDLGVLLLDLAAKPPHVTLPAPAALPTLGLLDDLHAGGGLAGETFAAVGYGLARRDGKGQARNYLRPLYSRNTASSKFKALLDDQVYFLQEPSPGYGGICYGDSGGPYFYDVGGVETIMVVVDRVDPNCLALGGGARLDTEEARSFLAEYVTLP